MSGYLPMPAMPAASGMPSMPAMPAVPVPPRRMTLPERVALRLGQALVAWSSRPRRRIRLRREVPPREYNAHEYRERAAARAAREDHWARAMYHRHPWR